MVRGGEQDAANVERRLLVSLHRDGPGAVRIDLASYAKRASQALNSGEEDAASAALDEIATTAQALSLGGNRDLVEFALNFLIEAYNSGFVAGDHIGDLGKARWWLSVLVRLYGTATVALRSGEWSVLRSIAQIRLYEAEQYWQTKLLFTHALTMAVRAGLFGPPNDADASTGSIISETEGYLKARQASAIHRGWDEYGCLADLCRVDALAGLVIASTGEEFYPSFPQYTAVEVEPLIVRLIHDPGMRAALELRGDAELRRSLQNLSGFAARAARRFGRWHGWTSPQIMSFLEPG